MITRIMSDGWVPNARQAKLAHIVGKISDVDNLMELAAPWSATDQPPVVKWSDYKPVLQAEAEACQRLREQSLLLPWWKRAEKLGLNIEQLFVASQGSKGCCAGFSMFQNAYLITLIKQIGRGSEQSIERVNAMVAYAISHGCTDEYDRIPDGQTIAAVLKYAASTGTFPAALAGEYDASTRYKGAWNALKPEAAKRQMGVCPIADDSGNSLSAAEMAEAVKLALKADKVVEIGNNVAVRGNHMDGNGVSVVDLGGRWAHATVFDEYQNINGKEYYHWTNSHGLIYNNSDGSPRMGTSFLSEQVDSFFGGSLSDAGVVVYAESPHGADNPDLNPMEIQ